MADNIKISVIVLVYKNLDKLPQTIKSAIQQTFSHYEIYIRDDGSSPTAEEDIKRLVKSDLDAWGGQYRIISNEKNLGTVRNYNLSIIESKGKYIVPLSNGDRFYDNHVLQTIYDFFIKRKCLVCTSYRKMEDSGKIYPSSKFVNLLKDSRRSLGFLYLINNFISGAVTYFDKDFFNKYGLFDEKFRVLEDYPILFHFLLNGGNIHFLPAITIIYDVSGISNAKTPNRQLLEDYRRFDEYRYTDRLFRLNIKENYLFHYRKDCRESEKNRKRFIYIPARIYLRFTRRY